MSDEEINQDFETEDDDPSCPICGVYGCDGNCFPKPAGCEDPEEEDEELEEEVISKKKHTRRYGGKYKGRHHGSKIRDV